VTESKDLHTEVEQVRTQWDLSDVWHVTDILILKDYTVNAADYS